MRPILILLAAGVLACTCVALYREVALNASAVSSELRYAVATGDWRILDGGGLKGFVLIGAGLLGLVVVVAVVVRRAMDRPKNDPAGFALKERSDEKATSRVHVG